MSDPLNHTGSLLERNQMEVQMRRYTKKPVTIEALEWTGDNLKEIIEFTGLHLSAQKWSWKEYEEVVNNEGLKIFTLEGKMSAEIGDMIIKGVQGEFYPCKPDIFKLTYTKGTSNCRCAEYRQLIQDLIDLSPRIDEVSDILCQKCMGCDGNIKCKFRLKETGE